MVIKNILKCFELVLELRVNFHKSQIGAIGIDDITLNHYSIILNCSSIKISFKYLEMIRGRNPRKKEFWKDLLTKVMIKLSSLKGKVLARRIRCYLILVMCVS